MNLRACIFVSAFLLISDCLASPRSVDAEKFDIAGARLGMSPQAAASAVSAKLGIDRKAIEFDSTPQQNIVTNSKEPRYFNAKTKGASLTVYFEPSVPYDPKNKMVVSMIVYEQPWTPENVSAMKKMAIEKFGLPSNGTIGMSYQWCLRPHSNPGFGCSEFRGPKLELSGTKLQLEDFTYRQAVIDHMDRNASSKPSF